MYFCCQMLIFVVSASAANAKEQRQRLFPGADKHLQNFNYQIDPECVQEPEEICMSNSKKALDQTCKYDAECIAPAVCVNNKCKCAKSYVRKNGFCIPAPGFDQPCPDKQCVDPFICSKNTLHCDCPQYMNRTADGCKLECGKNEVAVKTECFKKRKLGKSCNSSLQCTTAYSQCIDSRCQCAPGTKKLGSSCAPKPKCPDGSSPSNDSKGKLIPCTVNSCNHQPSPSLPIKTDTCPKDSYCVFPYQNLVDGYCCPKVQFCPMGAPLPGKKCTFPLMSEGEKCPSETHHCYAGPMGVACCPLPCPSVTGGLPSVVVSGECLPKVHLNQPCTFDQQCPVNAECNKTSGTCLCPDGYTAQYHKRGDVQCRKICPVPFGRCKHSAQCTSGTRCRKNKCRCPCNMVMYNGHCIPKPLCPDFGSYFGSRDPLTTKDGYYRECSLQLFGTCPKNSYCAAVSPLFTGGICCPHPEPTCGGDIKPQMGSNGKPVTCNLPHVRNNNLQFFVVNSCSPGHLCWDYLNFLLPGTISKQGLCCPNHMFLPVSSSLQNRQSLDLFSSSGNAHTTCPVNHVLALNSVGNAVTCNYFNYFGECGQKAGCFYAGATSLGALNSGQLYTGSQTGVCCNWKKPQ